MNSFDSQIGQHSLNDNQYYLTSNLPSNNLIANDSLQFGIHSYNDDCLKYESQFNFNNNEWNQPDHLDCSNLLTPYNDDINYQPQVVSDSNGNSITNGLNGDHVEASVSPRKMVKPKPAKKVNSKKDNNRIPKPVSAYALFFRDAQATIKGSNPNASFGEISKIVADNWENLEKETKDIYKQRADEDKKNYLKALAANRAQQIAGLINETRESEVSKVPTTDGDDSNQNSQVSSSTDHANDDSQKQNKTNESQGEPSSAQENNETKPTIEKSNNNKNAENKCIRRGCDKPAVVSFEWDAEYCSAECCTKHCDEVFQAWVAEQAQQQTHSEQQTHSN